MLEARSPDMTLGLQLVDQVAVDQPGSIDACNIEPPGVGRIMRRDGYEQLASSGLSGVKTLGYSLAGGGGHVLGCGGTTVVARDLTGASVASRTVVEGERGSIVAVGSPAAARSFVANGKDLVLWDGSALSLPTVTHDGVGGAVRPKPIALAVTPWDSRLMFCGFLDASDGPGGIVSSGSHIYFAEAGDPLVTNALWYEIVTPGDGESIACAVRWRDRVVVFKQSRFFTFYSSSTDGAGNPALNYFTVDEGIGAVGSGAACAGPDGVYVVSRRGIFRTNGTDVEHVSSELDPLFGIGAAPYYRGPALDVAALHEVTLQAVGNRIFMSYPTTAGGRACLVHDVRFSGWVPWTLPATGMVGVPINRLDRLYFGDGTGLYRQGGGLTDDAGAAIEAWRQSGFESYGMVGEKTIRQSRLWGEGDIAVSYAPDFRGLVGAGTVDLSVGGDTWGDGSDPTDTWGDGTDPSETWGVGSQVRDGWVRHAVRGSFLSTRVANVAGGGMSVHLIENHLVDYAEAARDMRAADA